MPLKRRGNKLVRVGDKLATCAESVVCAGTAEGNRPLAVTITIAGASGGCGGASNCDPVLGTYELASSGNTCPGIAGITGCSWTYFEEMETDYGDGLWRRGQFLRDGF